MYVFVILSLSSIGVQIRDNAQKFLYLNAFMVTWKVLAYNVGKFPIRSM